MSKNSWLFTEGQRLAQEKYGTVGAAHSLVDHPYNASDMTELWPGFKEFIENCPFFFIATSSATGKCNCNFRGGGRGVVLVRDAKTLFFADFAGNGILHAIGDLFENPQIGMLFIDFANRQRLKLSGHVTIIDREEDLKEFRVFEKFARAVRVIQVNVEYAVPNCPRYLDSVMD